MIFEIFVSRRFRVATVTSSRGSATCEQLRVEENRNESEPEVSHFFAWQIQQCAYLLPLRSLDTESWYSVAARVDMRSVIMTFFCA